MHLGISLRTPGGPESDQEALQTAWMPSSALRPLGDGVTARRPVPDGRDRIEARPSTTAPDQPGSYAASFQSRSLARLRLQQGRWGDVNLGSRIQSAVLLECCWLSREHGRCSLHSVHSMHDAQKPQEVQNKPAPPPKLPSCKSHIGADPPHPSPAPSCRSGPGEYHVRS